MEGVFAPATGVGKFRGASGGRPCAMRAAFELPEFVAPTIVAKEAIQTSTRMAVTIDQTNVHGLPTGTSYYITHQVDSYATEALLEPEPQLPMLLN